MRFTVRGLVVLVLVIGTAMGWLARRINVKRDAAAAIKDAGGVVLYDRYYDSLNNPRSRYRGHGPRRRTPQGSASAPALAP